MKCERASGILLHPTSLPGPYGIGDLGSHAYRWIDFIVNSGCKLWQVLPLGPTGYGDSPYQCFSAFAGNPYLISPEFLQADGLLHSNDLIEEIRFPSNHVDFGAVIPWKLNLLERAFIHFENEPPPGMKDEFLSFYNDDAGWLEDYALFMAIKEVLGGRSWGDWPKPLRMRNKRALIEASDKYSASVRRFVFYQFLFFRQWRSLREYAWKHGVNIIGDLPIFVAYDSADVWAHPELFYLNDDRQPTVVAGVPPDYFSPTGQLWGNPLYRWDVHRVSGYTWWLHRFAATLKMVDVIRLDHFRGFAGYWEIPAGKPTAEIGRWVTGPGADFINAVKKDFSEMPLIAEDLGEITQDVIELREHFNLPGMKILQFAFSGPDNPFLPHHYRKNCIVYTGTHDNDTIRGWYASAPREERDFCNRYLGCGGEDIAWDFIRTAWASVAVYSITPMQDLLNLGSEARMNYPSRSSGNWGWRMTAKALSEELSNKLSELNFLYQR